MGNMEGPRHFHHIGPSGWQRIEKSASGNHLTTLTHIPAGSMDKFIKERYQAPYHETWAHEPGATNQNRQFVHVQRDSLPRKGHPDLLRKHELFQTGPIALQDSALHISPSSSPRHSPDHLGSPSPLGHGRSSNGDVWNKYFSFPPAVRTSSQKSTDGDYRSFSLSGHPSERLKEPYRINRFSSLINQVTNPSKRHSRPEHYTLHRMGTGDHVHEKPHTLHHVNTEDRAHERPHTLHRMSNGNAEHGELRRVQTGDSRTSRGSSRDASEKKEGAMLRKLKEQKIKFDERGRARKAKLGGWFKDKFTKEGRRRQREGEGTSRLHQAESEGTSRHYQPDGERTNRPHQAEGPPDHSPDGAHSHENSGPDQRPSNRQMPGQRSPSGPRSSGSQSSKSGSAPAIKKLD